MARFALAWMASARRLMQVKPAQKKSSQSRKICSKRMIFSADCDISTLAYIIIVGRDSTDKETMVRSQRVAKISDFLAPAASGWARIAGEEIALMPTPLPMQPTEYIRNSWEGRPYGGVKSLRVASVHDGETWAIRATWQGVSPAGKDFPDALAVALPVSGNPPLITMGGDGAPVQFLRWAANKDKPMSIVATGIGSSRPGAKIKSSAQGEATGDIWNVVITRALGFGQEVAPLLAGKTTQIGFAVWLGANDERAGIKAFSIDWAALALDA